MLLWHLGSNKTIGPIASISKLKQILGICYIHFPFWLSTLCFFFFFSLILLYRVVQLWFCFLIFFGFLNSIFERGGGPWVCAELRNGSAIWKVGVRIEFRENLGFCFLDFCFRKCTTTSFGAGENCIVARLVVSG